MSALAKGPLTAAETELLVRCERTIASVYGEPGTRPRRQGVRRSDRRAHEVYVHLAADGTVLYVGISLETRTRTTAHRASLWWQEVATIRVEHLVDRESALAREAELIAELRPLHNVAGVR